MSSANHSNFIGRLTRDPDLRFIPNSGKAVVNVTIAIEDEFDRQNKEKTLFMEGFTFGKAAETIANYCKKGKLFAMSGTLQPQHWDDKNSGKRQTKLKLFMTGFKILEWPNDQNQGQQNSYQQNNQQPVSNQQQRPQQQTQPNYQNDLNGFQAIDGDDDIPF